MFIPPPTRILSLLRCCTGDTNFVTPCLEMDSGRKRIFSRPTLGFQCRLAGNTERRFCEGIQRFLSSAVPAGLTPDVQYPAQYCTEVDIVQLTKDNEENLRSLRSASVRSTVSAFAATTKRFLPLSVVTNTSRRPAPARRSSPVTSKTVRPSRN